MKALKKKSIENKCVQKNFQKNNFHLKRSHSFWYVLDKYKSTITKVLFERENKHNSFNDNIFFFLVSLQILYTD